MKRFTDAQHASRRQYVSTAGFADSCPGMPSRAVSRWFTRRVRTLSDDYRRGTTRGSLRRHVGSALAMLAAVTLVASCSSPAAGSGSTAGSPRSVEPTPTGPATETAPSPDLETTQQVGSATAQPPPTITVRGPTLGANFSGTGDWHMNRGAPLAKITVFTQGIAEQADISLGLYAADGVEEVTYEGGQIRPSGTYFQLRSDECAGSLPRSSSTVEGTCADLVFDPTITAGAADPFSAALEFHLQLTCRGQSDPTCQHSPQAHSAGPDSPVVLTFTQSVALRGSIGCDPASDVEPPCADSSPVLSAVSTASSVEFRPPSRSGGSSEPSPGPPPTG